MQAVNAITPPLDLALFLGDVVHNGLDYSTDLKVLTQVRCCTAVAYQAHRKMALQK